MTTMNKAMKDSSAVLILADLQESMGRQVSRVRDHHADTHCERWIRKTGNYPVIIQCPQVVRQDYFSRFRMFEKYKTHHYPVLIQVMF